MRDILVSFVIWRRYPALIAIAACVVISNVGNMAVRTALLLVTYRAFGLGPVAAGWILGTGGLASVLGATLAGRASTKLGIGPSLVIATTIEGLAWAIAPLGLAGAPFVVLGVASALSGVMTPIWNVNVVTLRQRIVAGSEQGRVVAVSRAFATAGVAIGAIMGGALATILEAALGEQMGLVAAMTAGALGSTFTQAHIALDDSVPASNPQNPPAGVARFHNMPSSTVPNSGAMKKLNRACT